jgi:hypothetical protein
VKIPLPITPEFSHPVNSMRSSGLNCICQTTWSVRNDTIVLLEENDSIPQYLPVRIIAPNKLECHWTYTVNGVAEHDYWFLEKW